MKACSYCGRESQDEAGVCHECGNSLAPLSAPSEPASSGQPAGELNARSATIILLLYLAAQLGAGMIGGIIAVAASAIHDGSARTLDGRAGLSPQILGPITVIAFALSGAVMFKFARARIHSCLKDISQTGAAWVRGSFKAIAQGLVTGILLACCYLSATIIFQFQSDQREINPLISLATTPGLPRFLFLLAILGLAPLLEELLFRGVLYGGYCKSYGPLLAGILSTVIFWLLHITEMIHVLPAMPSVAILAVVALWFRLNSAAIGPAVAVHFGYNSVLAAVLIFSAR